MGTGKGQMSGECLHPNILRVERGRRFCEIRCHQFCLNQDFQDRSYAVGEDALTLTLSRRERG